MAEIAFTKPQPDRSMRDTVLVLYSSIPTGGDTAQEWVSADYADKSFFIYEGAGTGSIFVQGTNDPRYLSDPSNCDWVTAKDTAGSDITVVANTAGSTPAFGTIRDNFYALRINSSGTVTAGRVAFCGKRVR